jgi:hypothetical protein
MVKPLKKKTYLTVIENSIGSNTYRNSYALVDGEEKDILKNGRLSCAFYVSSILLMFGLIKEIHSTVSGTQRDLEISGWQKVDSFEQGDVIFWEEVEGEDGRHGHVGFFWDEHSAISNDSNVGSPAEHNLNFGANGQGPRKVVFGYRHPSLED